MIKRHILKAAQLATLPQPRPPTLSPPKHPLDGRGTGAKLLSTLDMVADTLRVQVSQATGETRIPPSLVKTIKDAAQAWATLHGEMRESITALTNEQYREVLESLALATRAGDPPLPPSVAPGGALEAHANFFPAEDSITPSPTSSQSETGGINRAGGRAAPLPLEFDDE